MNNFTGKKETSQSSSDQYYQPDAQPESKGMAFGRGASRSPSRSTTNSTIPLYYDQDREAARTQRRSNAPPSRDTNARYDKALPQPPTSNYQPGGSGYNPTPPPVQRKQYRDDGYGGNLLDPTPATVQQEPVDRYYTPAENYDQMPSSPAQGTQYQPTSSGSYTQYPPQSSGGYSASNTQALYAQPAASVNARQQIRPSNRKFEYDSGGHSGSSSATRRVMDFFRRRGKDRSEA
jgi:protein-serine/threonine kinase